MPKPEDLRSELMRDVPCDACGKLLQSKVPVGVSGYFFHQACFQIWQRYEQKHIHRRPQTPAA